MNIYSCSEIASRYIGCPLIKKVVFCSNQTNGKEISDIWVLEFNKSSISIKDGLKTQLYPNASNLQINDWNFSGFIFTKMTGLTLSEISDLEFHGCNNFYSSTSIMGTNHNFSFNDILNLLPLPGTKMRQKLDIITKADWTIAVGSEVHKTDLQGESDG